MTEFTDNDIEALAQLEAVPGDHAGAPESLDVTVETSAALDAIAEAIAVEKHPAASVALDSIRDELEKAAFDGQVVLADEARRARLHAAIQAAVVTFAQAAGAALALATVPAVVTTWGDVAATWQAVGIAAAGATPIGLVAGLAAGLRWLGRGSTPYSDAALAEDARSRGVLAAGEIDYIGGRDAVA